MKNLTASDLERIVARFASEKIIQGAAFRVEATDGTFALASAGDARF